MFDLPFFLLRKLQWSSVRVGLRWWRRFFASHWCVLVSSVWYPLCSYMPSTLFFNYALVFLFYLLQLWYYFVSPYFTVSDMVFSLLILTILLCAIAHASECYNRKSLMFYIIVIPLDLPFSTHLQLEQKLKTNSIRIRFVARPNSWFYYLYLVGPFLSPSLVLLHSLAFPHWWPRHFPTLFSLHFIWAQFIFQFEFIEELQNITIVFHCGLKH